MKVRAYALPDSFDSPQFIPLSGPVKATHTSRIERFFTYGEFAVTMPYSTYNADRFKKYRALNIDRTYWGLILAQEKGVSETGNVLVVRGLCMKGITCSREAYPPGFTFEQVGGVAGYDAIRGSTETCMKHYINRNFFSEDSPTRRVPGLVIAADQNRGNPDDRYMTRFERVSGVLEELGTAAGIGYTIEPLLESGHIVFDCVEGVDRSAIQSDRPRIVFEIARKNVAHMNYINSDLNMRNVFYASLSGGEFVDDVYTATITREEELPAGIRRWEQHMDISASHPVPGAELDELRRLALLRAETYQTVETFEARILQTDKVYGVDYKLGDIVTAQNREYGISMHTRLTEMQIEGTPDSVIHTATFGSAPINPIERLRRQIRGG